MANISDNANLLLHRPIAVVSTVRTDEATLMRWLAYHRHCGVDRFLLFFDDPNDPVIENVMADIDVTVTRCNDAHWARARCAGLSPNLALDERQVFNTACALETARRERIGWLLHIDTDELLSVPRYDLRGYLLRHHGADAIAFPTLEAMPKAFCSRHAFEDIRWFKRPQSPIPGARRAAKLLGCRRLFRHGFVKGHAIGKSIVRTTADVSAIGVHRPAEKPGGTLRIIVARDAHLLHFDAATYEDWALKLQRRGDTALVVQIRGERKAQVAEFMSAAGDPKGQRALYEQLVPRKWQYVVLVPLLLVRRIVLPRYMFQR
jgi:hypothetical protein